MPRLVWVGVGDEGAEGEGEAEGEAEGEDADEDRVVKLASSYDWPLLAERSGDDALRLCEDGEGEGTGVDVELPGEVSTPFPGILTGIEENQRWQ